jgi:hypothetical protein
MKNNATLAKQQQQQQQQQPFGGNTGRVCRLAISDQGLLYPFAIKKDAFPYDQHMSTGWWFQTFCMFHHILGIIIPLTFILFKMVKTTNIL